MHPNFMVREQLFRSSGTTSEVVDLRDAFDFSISIHTSGGTTSTLTVQTSGWTGRTTDGDPPEASWSLFTSTAPSSATVIHPPLGVPWLRMLKGSLGTFVITYAKHVR